MVRGLLIAFQSILNTVKLTNTQHKNIISPWFLYIFFTKKSLILFFLNHHTIWIDWIKIILKLIGIKLENWFRPIPYVWSSWCTQFIACNIMWGHRFCGQQQNIRWVSLWNTRIDWVQRLMSSISVCNAMKAHWYASLTVEKHFSALQFICLTLGLLSSFFAGI